MLGTEVNESMNSKPLISIITPSYNCAPYIRGCVESVLAQDYENFEHIIVDGASNDGTLEILKQYPHLKWISEQDSGEAEALNKALRMAHGDIIGWLNADDCYVEGTFQRVANEIDPQADRHVIYGKANYIDEEGKFIARDVIPPKEVTFEHLLRWWSLGMTTPTAFYSKEVVNRIGFFIEDEPYAIDYEYWLRIGLQYRFHFVNQTFASARWQTSSKRTKLSLAGHLAARRKVQTRYSYFLTPRQRFRLWWDYYCFFLFHASILGRQLDKVRARIRLRTRLRQLFARIKTKS